MWPKSFHYLWVYKNRNFHRSFSINNFGIRTSNLEVWWNRFFFFTLIESNLTIDTIILKINFHRETTFKHIFIDSFWITLNAHYHHHQFHHIRIQCECFFHFQFSNSLMKSCAQPSVKKKKNEENGKSFQAYLLGINNVQLCMQLELNNWAFFQWNHMLLLVQFQCRLIFFFFKKEVLSIGHSDKAHHNRLYLVKCGMIVNEKLSAFRKKWLK